MTSTPYPPAPLQKAPLSEAQAFLAAYPDVQAIDIVLSDLHGVGRGKIIRRHELESLFTSGRGMPASLFAQDVSGHDVEDAIACMNDGGGDSRCWPVPHTLVDEDVQEVLYIDHDHLHMVGDVCTGCDANF